MNEYLEELEEPLKDDIHEFLEESLKKYKIDPDSCMIEEITENINLAKFGSLDQRRIIYFETDEDDTSDILEYKTLIENMYPYANIHFEIVKQDKMELLDNYEKMNLYKNKVFKLNPKKGNENEEIRYYISLKGVNKEEIVSYLFLIIRAPLLMDTNGDNS